MAINDATISSDVWTTIRARLVTDNIQNTAPIKNVYNNEVPTRPIIVITPAQIGEDSFKFGSTTGKRMINVVIEIYAAKSGDVDTTSDLVYNSLSQNDITGMDLVGVQQDYGFVTAGDNKYHIKTLTFVYERQ